MAENDDDKPLVDPDDELFSRLYYLREEVGAGLISQPEFAAIFQAPDLSPRSPRKEWHRYCAGRITLDEFHERLKRWAER